MTDHEVDAIMEAVQPTHRYRWCNPGDGGCACLGCANRSGKAASKGVTEAEWQAWVVRNPKPPGLGNGSITINFPPKETR